MRRRERFDSDSASAVGDYTDATARLATSIRNASELVKRVVVPKQVRGFIAEICNCNHVAGHRVDITIERAACAHAALNGRTQVSADDVLAVAPMALLHCMRTGEPPQMPPPPQQQDEEQQEESGDQNQDQEQDKKAQSNTESSPGPSPESAPQEQQQDSAQAGSAESSESQPPPLEQGPEKNQAGAPSTKPEEERHAVGQPFAVKSLLPRQDRQLRTGSGRRTQSRSASKQGRYVKSSPRRSHDDLALDATLRAAAPFQLYRRQQGDSALAVLIQEQDIREKIRERRVGASLLFVVDGSGSMGAHRRMIETKAAIMSLLMDAYQKRDKVGLIVFRQQEAEVLLDFTGSIERAALLLTDLPVGGRTPLSAGLARTAEVLQRLLRKDPAAQPLVLVLTDGRANVGFGSQKPHHEALAFGQLLAGRFAQARFVVVDTEPEGAIRLQLAKRLATAMAADYYRTEDLRAEELVQLAQQR